MGKFFEMFFALAIITVIFGSIFGFPLMNTWLKQRARARDAVEESLRDELRARLAELEERVRVLERIVTDESAQLRRQFKDL